MQSSHLSQHTFQDQSQDNVCSEENDLPVEVHDCGLGPLSLQINSTPGTTNEEARAVHRLPVEMLSEVFLVCAHTLDQSDLIQMERLDRHIPPHHHRLMFARNAVPYIVSSVCRRWRSIGLSTPKLWSRFTISCSPNYPRKKFMVALRIWLKRSKNHPLQFTCVSFDDTEDAVLMELFKNIHRWHIAYFGDHDASFLARQEKWFGNDGLKAENLVTLELKRCDDDLDIAFQRFPNLRRLTIHPNCLAVEQARGLNLTHLTLTELEGDTATFFSYFRQFPSLISFEAPVNELDHHWSHPPLTPFTHTTLTELTITRYKGDGISLRNILANIHVPSIRRLSLEYWFPCTHFSQANEMADIVHDFIRRHESTFTNFELSHPETSCNEMIEILHMFPKYLTSYASIHERLTDEYVKRLTLDPLDPAQDLAPDLSSISLYVQGGTPSGDLLAEMILSRWARNPHTTFNLSVGYYKGFNPLSNPRFARRVQHSPGLFFIHDRSAQ